MRERLVSYLLGELDATEARELEAQVEADPQLSKQLEHLRGCLMLAQEEAAPDEPPSGLADRTADSVHDLVLGLESAQDNPAVGSVGARLKGVGSKGVGSKESGGKDVGAGGVETAAVESPGRCSSFTLVDGVVAAGVVVALGMMLLPALQESRVAARRQACQNNLYQLGQAALAYGDRHAGLMPHVQAGENAGIYAVRLGDGGLVDRKRLAQLVVCKSSELAERIARGAAVVRVPTADELKRATPVESAELRRWMGGSYAYRLGYLDGPLYLPIKSGGNSRSPLMSDAPNPQAAGRWQSLNHGGCGQNVLFKDGSVSYRVNCLLPDSDDNFFVNAHGEAAAGRGWNDAVMVRSEVTPGVFQAFDRAAQRSAPRYRVRGYVRIHSLPATPTNRQAAPPQIDPRRGVLATPGR